VLNGFAYTCSFGVYARSFGASRVVNVDVSQKYLDRGIQNYALNELPSLQDEFVKSDVEKYLSIAVKKKNLFDVIILDPPSFSRYESEVFTVKKALPKLIDSSLQILKSRGHLFVSTNFSEISTGLLGRWIQGSSEILQRPIKKIIPLGQDKDFPGSETMRESHLAALLVNFK
jgi:23S rRNA (cytosine1962-C5)-methyltransferase